MPLSIFMSKYQRFVAWRYLMEREPRLSSPVLSFIGFCLWLALGMAAACLWYPLADPFMVPPPNAPGWIIPLVGLAWALPIVGLLSAGMSAARGLVARIFRRGGVAERPTARPNLLRACHWSLVAVATFTLFQSSLGAGFVRFEIVIFLWLAIVLDVPVVTKRLVHQWQGRRPKESTSPLAMIPGLIGVIWWTILQVAWILQTVGEVRVLRPLGWLGALLETFLLGLGELLRTWLRWGLLVLFPVRLRRPLLNFVLAFQLAALEVVLVAVAYVGFREEIAPQLFPESGVVPLWGKVAIACVVVFVGAVLLHLSLLSKKRGRPIVLNTALAFLVFALIIGTSMRFFAGVSEVTVNLDFLGGWASYTPPMGMVMPALVAAAIAVLAGVLLIARFLFTFFSTVSMGGVTIGTMALVIVLSVMSGFETDLREKILGFNAHIQISRTDELQFEGYREVQAILEKTDGVEGFTPFLTTEAYMSNHNNYGNVTLKGIDPSRVAGVTEIVHNLEAGDERALEKLWPLEEDGSIAGEPLKGGSGEDFELDDGPADFSGGLDEIEEQAFDDFDLDEPEDLSGGLEELPDAGPMDGLITAPPIDTDWDVDLRPHDYIDPNTAVLDGVLVGRELVKTVNLYTDQEVRVISPLPDTSPDGLSIPRLKNFRVAGRFFSGMYEYDLKYVYCSLHALQDFLDLGDVVNGIEVRVTDPRNTAAIVRSLETSLGEGYRVQDWKELNRALFSALKLEKIAMFFILVIIVLVASFSIVGNLIMVVIEKAKEIAILKTLGSSDGGVMKIFITQGFFIGLVGTSLGVALGLGACYLGVRYGVPLDPDVYYIDKLPIQVEGSSVVAVGCAGLAISVVATIYPAFIAARMRPVKGLRWD